MRSKGDRERAVGARRAPLLTLERVYSRAGGPGMQVDMFMVRTKQPNNVRRDTGPGEEGAPLRKLVT
eukprot:5114857-Prorocentrum_lima.AAC.1